MEGRVGQRVIHAEQRQPLPCQCLLSFRRRLIESDRVEEAGKDHGAHVEAIVEVQATADVADMLFDIPDGFAAAVPDTEQRKVVAAALRVIAGHQAQQSRLASAVRSDNLPLFVCVDLPAQPVNYRLYRYKRPSRCAG